MEQIILHKERSGPLVIQLLQEMEQCHCDPRDCDNLGTMACWHGRYRLGDYEKTHDRWSEARDFRSWVQEDKPILLPLYLYDHSGLSMRTVDFGDPWDSGMVGWIYCELEKARKEYSVKQVTPTIRKKIQDIMRLEVELYDAHLACECYGWQVSDEDGNHLDSCWGYHGYHRIDWDYALSQARDSAASVIETLAHAPNL